jgi:hypothetical protein
MLTANLSTARTSQHDLTYELSSHVVVSIPRPHANESQRIWIISTTNRPLAPLARLHRLAPSRPPHSHLQDPLLRIQLHRPRRSHRVVLLESQTLDRRQVRHGLFDETHGRLATRPYDRSDEWSSRGAGRGGGVVHLLRGDVPEIARDEQSSREDFSPCTPRVITFIPVYLHSPPRVLPCPIVAPFTFPVLFAHILLQLVCVVKGLSVSLSLSLSLSLCLI